MAIIRANNNTLSSVTSLPSGVGGITGFDNWRHTTNTSASSNGDIILTSNLARNNDTTFSKIGTGMTESSGVFSFPEIGNYLIQFGLRIRFDSASGNVFGRIELSNDNGSNWNSEIYTLIPGTSSSQQNSGFGQVAFNVTNVSNDKVRFVVGGMLTGNDIIGDADTNATYMHFIKMA